MKGDLPAVALRLSSALPVRTHLRPVPVNEKVGLKLGQHPKHKQGKRAYHEASNRGRGGHNAIAIIIAGKRYPSIKLAARALKIGNTRIYGLIDTGAARYAKEHE